MNLRQKIGIALLVTGIGGCSYNLERCKTIRNDVHRMEATYEKRWPEHVTARKKINDAERYIEWCQPKAVEVLPGKYAAPNAGIARKWRKDAQQDITNSMRDLKRLQNPAEEQDWKAISDRDMSVEWYSLGALVFTFVTFGGILSCFDGYFNPDENK